MTIDQDKPPAGAVSAAVPGYAARATMPPCNGNPGAERLAGGSAELRPYYADAAVTIYHGDCRQIMPLLGAFDLLMADPPYGVNIGKRNGLGRNGAAKVKDYGAIDWDKEMVDEWVILLARRLCSKQIIFGGNYYALPPTSCWLMWDKENTGEFADGEMAWTNLEKPVRIKRHMWNGMLRKGQEPKWHPTQKPLEVIQWAIMQAGAVETILDPWAGSGTTGHAAKNLGKRAVLIEREERYCEIAARRLAQDVLPLTSEGAEQAGSQASDDFFASPHNRIRAFGTYLQMKTVLSAALKNWQSLPGGQEIETMMARMFPAEIQLEADETIDKTKS